MERLKRKGRECVEKARFFVFLFSLIGGGDEPKKWEKGSGPRRPHPSAAARSRVCAPAHATVFDCLFFFFFLFFFSVFFLFSPPTLSSSRLLPFVPSRPIHTQKDQDMSVCCSEGRRVLCGEVTGFCFALLPDDGRAPKKREHTPKKKKNKTKQKSTITQKSKTKTCHSTSLFSILIHIHTPFFFITSRHITSYTTHTHTYTHTVG
eukprot:TRINITY_DN1633_c0_g5_i1.p1 TRINITY_DN1633_c0_g5~~TRINITY_DN1633_c0_g5_i1.p1  ORF type:complete len:206 (+),score=10.25 TRINITY_DN1633_c0_g5_i1:187-804(+)